MSVIVRTIDDMSTAGFDDAMLRLSPATGAIRKAVEMNTVTGDDGRAETSNQRADRNWNELLQEVRVTQTCTQIIGGFLLAVAFQPRFTELDRYQIILYLILVALAGFATALALALVMLHRIHFGKQQKVGVVLTGNRLLKVNLVIVACLAAGVTSLVFDFVLNRTAGFFALGAGLLISFGLWVFVPLTSRRDEV